MTPEEQILDEECKILLSAKKILTDYHSTYDEDSNAIKLDNYLSDIGNDMNNPFFMLKNNLKTSTNTLDMLFVMKKSQLLKLN